MFQLETLAGNLLTFDNGKVLPFFFLCKWNQLYLSQNVCQSHQHTKNNKYISS